MSELFMDPSLGYIGIAKLRKKLKAKGIKVSEAELKEFYKNAEVVQVNRPIKVKTYYRITAPPGCYQIDVVVMPARLKGSNGGVHKLLVLIEILSRKAFVYPLKSNKTADLVAAYEAFLGEAGKQVMMVEGDAEFDNKEFVALNDKRNIMVLTDVAKDDHLTQYGDKLGIVDAFTKNLKNRLRQYMEAHDTNKFVDVLDAVVAGYNDTPHSSLKDATPDEVYEDEAALTELQAANGDHNARVDGEVAIAVGDKVRVALGKGKLDKQKATFSKEVHEVLERVHKRFRVSGLERLYKPYELLRVDEAKVIPTKAATQKNIQAAATKAKVARKMRKEGIAPSTSALRPRRSTRST